VRNKKAKTELVAKSGNEKVFQLIKRAENWLQKNPAHAKVRKWETKMWGEIPADFGRK
jgi:ribonuclease HI